jgi:hypothetical protein
MREFDWEFAKTKTSPSKLNWLWLNHKKPLTQMEYVHAVRQLRQFSLSKHASNNYSKYRLKKDYTYLQNNFGFFL